MPLPENNIPWIPDVWRQTYDLYALHAAWYSGDPGRLADVYSRLVYTPTALGRFWAKETREERRVMLHVPIAGDLVATSADLLFSEQPEILIPEAHAENAPTDAIRTQERLDELTNLADVLSRLVEAAETAAALGGVFLVPGWDTSVADYPLLAVYQADNALPDFRWGILRSVTFWRDLTPIDTNDDVVWRHVELHEPGLILHGLYRGTSDNLGRRVSLNSHPETAGLKDEVTLPGVLSDVLLPRYVPNMRPNRRNRGSFLGQSDYSGSEGLMDALDEVYTSWMRDIRLGRGRIVVPEEWLERTSDGKFKFDVDQEVFTALDIDPSSASGKGLDHVQFEIRMEEHRGTANDLLEQIVNNAGYSLQTFGLQIDGRAESGTALRIRERKSFVTRQKKERYFVKAIEDVLHAMLMIDREVFNRRDYSVEYRPRVAMADSVQPDPLELAQTASALRNAEAASIDTLVRMIHPTWTNEEVEAEVRRISEERGLTMPDPMQTGLG